MTINTLQVFLDDHLARFKHPRDIVFLDELPRNAGGKVVKSTLRHDDATRTAQACDTRADPENRSTDLGPWTSAGRASHNGSAPDWRF